MRTYYFLILSFIFCNTLKINAQNIENPDLDILIQEIFAERDEDLNYEEVYENFYTLIADPIPLNKAEKADLQKLYLLSDRQISSFFTYKNQNGKFLSIYELQAIPDWDLTTIYKLLPFVQIRETELNADTRSLWKRIKSEKNNYLLLRWERTLESKYGFTDEAENPYLGSPNRLFLRFRMSHTKDFSLDFRAEKDAGEKFTINSKSKRYGFDYYSGHFALYNKGRVKKFIIGDYRIQIGQGLISSAGFNFGKGAESVQTVRRNSLGILPYGSVTEYGFWRGSALTYEIAKNCTFTGFVSNKKTDGSVVFSEIDTTQISYFKSRVNIGYHRTETELNQKNLLRETIFGGNLNWQSNSKNAEFGVTFLQTWFNYPIIPAWRLYKTFDFQGDKNTNFGFNYAYVWQNFNFFGETAFTNRGGFGTVNGLLSSLSKRVDLAILWRKYSTNFYNFYGNAFGENYINKNESGLYFGLKYAPNRSWQWTIYYDKFRFPWLKFQINSPSEGYEFMTQIKHHFSRSISAYFRLRIESKERNTVNSNSFNSELSYSLKANYQFNVDYSIRNKFSMRSRIQFSDFEQKNTPKSSGFVLVQDFNFKFKKSQLSTRFALFDTDDFENRQYVYEKDVLYSFSIPAYYGQGLRTYVLFQQKINKKIDFWVKYAVYSYQNRNEIGSGLDKIEGNHKRDIRFQVRYKF